MDTAIQLDSLDPRVENLFRFFGVIDSHKKLNPEWLKNPMKELRESVYSHPDLLLEILEDLLDAGDAQTQGIPGPNPGDRWQPVPGIDTDILYITTRQTEKNGSQHLLIGLGLKWTPEAEDLDFNLWAQLPLIDVDIEGQSISFALGGEISPVLLAFSVSHEEGFGTAEMGFDGARLCARVFFDQEPELAFRLENMWIGDQAPQTLNIADISGIDPEKWFRLAFSLISARLQNLSEDEDIDRIISHVFPILGLTGSGPLIPWWQLPEQGIGVLGNWLEDLVQDSSALDAWLSHWYDMLGAEDAAEITGAGTRADPRRIRISSDQTVDLYLTLAYPRGNQGYQIYPGLILAIAGQSISEENALSINFQTRMELFRLSLSGSGGFDPLPDFDLCARLYKPDDELVDVDFSDAGSEFDFLGAFKVRELRAGLGLVNASRIEPSLKLVNVRSNAGNWAVIDLSSGKEMLEQLENVANTVITKQIQELLGTGAAADHPGKHVAALLGLIPPTHPDRPDPWPADLAVSIDRLADFLGNPLAALACYHSQCIAQRHNAAPLWQFLVHDLAALLKHTSILSADFNVSGDGSPEDPWQIDLYAGSGGKALLSVSARSDADSGPARLETALVLEPEAVALGDAAGLMLSCRVGLMRLALPAGDQCPGKVDARWLENIAIAARVQGKPQLTASTAIGLNFSLDWLELGCTWKDPRQFDWGVTLENFQVTWTLDPAQSFSLPRFQFGGGFDLQWNLADLADMDIDLPDFSILFKLCLGAWLVERGGSFGFGFAALFGLFPSPDFEWPELPDLNLQDLELPDWNSGPFAFPDDWPRFEVPDWHLFFENPWPDILAHLKRLFSKPSWALPALRFLGGSLFGRFPDFSLPDLGWGGEGGIAMPGLPDLPFSVSGAGTYEKPWALRLNLETVRPFELLVWLDPDGPPADDWANVLLSFLPEEWRDLEGLRENESFGLAELAQLLEQLEIFSPGIERVLSGAGGASLANHLTALAARLRRSDGLVPYPSQVPATDLPNWEAPFDLADLPRVDHFHQLSNEMVLDTAAAQINAASGETPLPVLCLGAAWESTDAWSDLLGRFPDAGHAHFNLREAGTDPDQIGLKEIPLSDERFFIGDISVFNTAAGIAPQERLLPVEGETPSADSQAKQVMRMVSRIQEHTGQKVILVAHSHAGLAALAAVQLENAKAPADKKIARLVTIGTPLASTPLVWAAEELAITGDDLEDALPDDLNIKAALEEALAFLDRLGPGDLPVMGDTVKDALSGLMDVLNADLNLPGIMGKAFPAHAFDGVNNPAVDVPACAIGSRLPDFDLKAAVLGWLESFLETPAPGGSDGADEQAPTHLGLGIRYSSRYQQDDMVFIQRIRLDVFRAAITEDANAPDTADVAAYPPLPRLSWDAELLRENGWLVGGLGKNPRVRRVELGLVVDFAHTIPKVVLHEAFLDGVGLVEARLTEVLSEVPEQAYDPEATLQRLMNRVIETAADPAAGSEMFRCACELLTHLQLVQKEGDGYRFSMEGWQSLLNDADTFLFSRLETLATDADARGALFDDLNTCFGIDLADFPASLFADFNFGEAGERLALKHLLSGLDLLLDAASGHDPNPVAWVELLTDPGAFIEDLLESLFLSPAGSSPIKLAVKNALELDEIARPLRRVDYSPAFSVHYAAEGIYELCWRPIPETPGSAIRLEGCAKIDLPGQSVALSVKGGPTALDLWVNLGLEMVLNADLEFEIAPQITLSPGTSTLPYGYPALQLYPQNPELMTELGRLLPRFALNTALAALLEKQVIPENTAWGELLVDLGIACRRGEQSRIQLRPIDGLIQNPKDWFLSPIVAGADADGQTIDPAKIKKMVNHLAQALDLADADGAIHLPYGLKLECSQLTGLRLALTTDTPLELTDTAALELSLALKLSPGCQVGVSANGGLQFELPDIEEDMDLWDTLSVQTGYNEGDFHLAVGINSSDLTLYPFGGWSSLVDLAGQQAARLLDTALDALLTELETDDAISAFISQVRDLPAVLDLDTPAKIDTMLENPLGWLNTRLNAANTDATLTALAGVLQMPIPDDLQLKDSSRRLCYSPSEIPLQLCIGRKSHNIGAWVELTDFVLGPLNLTVSLGVETPNLNETPDISISLTLGTADALYQAGDLALSPSLSFNLAPNDTNHSLAILPIGDALGPDQPKLTLLPASDLGFACDAACLKSLLTKVLLPVCLEVLLDSDPVSEFLNTSLIDDADIQPGEILTAINLLHKNEDGSFDLIIPDTFNPESFVQGLLASALKALEGQSFFDEALAIVTRDIDGGKTHYGIRVRLPDVTLVDDPELVLQLGSGDTEWLGDAAAEGVGLYFFLPTLDSSADNLLDSLGALPVLDLVNLGLDISGKNDDPLLDSGGFRINGVNVRIYFGVSFDEDIDLRLGGALKIVQIGLPIGSAGGNPVAGNLLSDDSGSGGENTPVNPAFSIELSYYEDLDVRLEGRNAGEAEIWFPIQKTFGPIHIGQVGVRWYNADKALEMLIDGGVTLGGLGIFVDDLGVKFKVAEAANLSKWKLGLKGLGVSFDQGGVKISGALLKDNEEGTSYSGAVLVEVSGKTFTAIGSYAQDPDTSMFVFVLLPITIGGPPYLFIIGLAGGFGYNRGLNVPPVAQVPGFPLVEAARGSSAFTKDPLSALQELGDAVPIKRGAYWLCGGIRFTSFKLATSAALAYVLLDRGVEVGLLGISQMKLPEGKPLVSLELALKARFSTVEGLLSIEARLSDNSWLLDRDCRLSGGFAFFVWFGGAHQGDFLITMGGYHPRFAKPAHYPDVPRLGFNWRVSSKITIKGESYFALTVSAVMAGGLLEAAYRSGNLKAWFKAWAHFLIAWKPFAYDIEIGISIGASYRLKVNLLFGTVTKTFKVELGAEVRIWGPKFSGRAKVNWWVISFTVKFGAGDSKTDQDAISWNQFSETFLPEADKLLSADVSSGMIVPGKKSAEEEDAGPWRLRPEFRIATETFFATSRVFAFGERVHDGELIDIRPMKADGLCSIHEIDIRHKNTDGYGPSAIKAGTDETLRFKTDNDGFIDIQIATAGVPAALWEFSGEGEKPEAKTIQSVTGVRIIAEIDESVINHTGQINVRDIFERGYHPLPFSREIQERGQIISFSSDAVLDLPDPDRPRSVFVASSKVLGLPWMDRRLSVLELLSRRGASLPREEARRPTPEILSRDAVAPPKIASLYEGMAPDPHLAPDVSEPEPEVEQPPQYRFRTPKLAAVLRQQARPVGDTVHQKSTTIETVLANRELPRVNVSRSATRKPAGAQLRREDVPTRPSTTRMQQRKAEFVADRHSSGRVRRQLADIETRAVTWGTQQWATARAHERESSPPNRVPAGTTQVWQLPLPDGANRVLTGEMPVVHFDGSQALRITAMSKGGRLLNDTEFPGGSGRLQLPPLTARIAVTGLGKISAGSANESSAMGAAALLEAADGLPAAGWQLNSQLIQISRLAFLGRGCALRAGADQLTRRNGRSAQQAVISAHELLEQQSTLTTLLPAQVSVVAIHVELDETADTRRLAEGVTVSSKGFILETPPAVIVSHDSAMLLYAAKRRDPAKPMGAGGFADIGTSIGTRPATGWRVTGVMGMKGSVYQWLQKLSARMNTPIVENGPLTPNGSSRVRFEVDDTQQQNMRMPA